MDRTSRLKIIQSLIRENPVSSQEDLSSLLLAQGISITQATLSRDLKLLGVGKTRVENGNYVYSLPENNPLKENQKAYQQDFLRGFLSLELSINVGVIRTLAGHASAVALALDQMEVESLLGCVAGDDTVILVIRAQVSTEKFLQELRDAFPGLEVS